jgi:peptidoglycan hydrolase-like protein with peptidoglycan-binding domain
VLGAVALLAVAAGAGAWFLNTVGAGAGSAPTAVAPPATARVTRQDLAETKRADGTLGYGDAHTVASGLAGVLTWLPAGGAKVSRGQPLYRVDDLPVVLMYGTVPPYRSLKVGDDGTDVKELEQNLSALGYAGFTVDDRYTDATAQAVRDWQEDLGLPETGSVEPGRRFVAPDAVRVATLKAEVAGRTAVGQPVLTYTGTARLVTVDLDVTDEALARNGAKVTVTLPDGGTTTKGTVTGVGTVAHKPDGQNTTGTGQQSVSSGDTATIDVTVTLDDPAAGGGLDAAPVDVDFVSEEHKGVLTVPVAALLALRDGGYGLELIDGTATRLVAVQVGLFANGRVEVSGPDIAQGATVGVPKS